MSSMKLAPGPVPPGAGEGLRPLSLRARVGAAIAASLLAASLALSAGLAAYAKREMLALAQENLDALAAQMARELSFGMDRFAREVELQATSPAFADAQANAAHMRARLETIQKTYPEFAHVSVIDVGTGTVLAATGGIFEGGNGKGRPVFEEGKKGLFVADVHDAVKLASLLPRPASGEPLRFLDVAAPIRGPAGEPIRVLGAHLSWEWTHAVKRTVLGPVEASRKVQLMLVDTSGRITLPPDTTIAMGTPLAQAMGEAAQSADAAWSDGSQYLHAQANSFASGAFPGLGWRVVARQPMSVALAASERLRAFFLAGGLLLGSFAAALGWLGAGRLVRPVAELASAAARLAPGSNLPARAPADDPQEVAQVREAFQRVTGEALRRAEALLCELNAIYEGAPVALAVIDAEGRYSRANRVWCEGVVDTDHSLEGRHLAQTRAPEALSEAVRRAICSGDPLAFEMDAPSKSGRRSWQCVLAPLRDERGAATGVSAVATDVTAIRNAERELRLADKRKDEFISMLAHELRNPLSPIMNAVEILDRAPDERLATRMRSMIRSQAKQMARIVEDLLDMARVNLGKISLRFEDVDLGDACEQAVDSQRHLAEANGQAIELHVEDGLPMVRGDKARLEQIVCNLVGNAIKYGRRGGCVDVSAKLAGGEILLTVADDGKGIAPEFLPYVFELFAQESPTAHGDAQGGLGIGLALVKKLAELHGGRVTAASEGRDRGSRFVVALPALTHPSIPKVAKANERTAPLFES